MFLFRQVSLCVGSLNFHTFPMRLRGSYWWSNEKYIERVPHESQIRTLHSGICIEYRQSSVSRLRELDDTFPLLSFWCRRPVNDELNRLNTCLQGPLVTIFSAFWKCFGIHRKDDTLEKHLWKWPHRNVYHHEWLSLKNDYEFEEIKPHVLTHLTNLESNFKGRFSDLTLPQHEWIWNPFAVTVGEKISHLSVKSQESLVELASDTSLRIKFEALPVWFLDLYPKRICGTPTTSHRSVTSFWHNIPVWKILFSNDNN
jgi:hypothetical protein